ncbi:hypothetical protein IAU60_004560 [Kwoniella sp. DSM 27419]
MIGRRLGSGSMRASVRVLHTRAQTFYSPTADFLETHLARHPASPGSTSAFLLSTSLPDLPGHLAVLQKHLPTYIGSFSTTAPGQEPTIALATFSDAEIRVFRSDLTGRPPAEVGRFQRPESQREKREEDLKGLGQGEAEARLAGEGWAGMWRSELAVERIAELEGVQADSFVLLSDGRPGPVLNALDAIYPSATKGNMLLSIEGANTNPTQMLIAAIQRRGGTGITKDEEFYLAILEDNKVVKVVQILSGDPSRGALSVDMEEPLVAGQTVQENVKVAAASPSALTFSALGRTDDNDDVKLGQPRVVEGFLGSSEGGFIYSTPTAAICAAPGATCTITV